MNKKIAEARETLELADQYMDSLNKYAIDMANITVDEAQLQSVLKKLFSVRNENSKRQVNNADTMKEKYMVCYFAPDIAKFRGTAWGALNAMADMVGHQDPNRRTQNFEENQNITT